MDKTGFELVPARLPDAVKLMTAFQPFRESSAFRELDDDDFALPGVVASAFARFVSELAVPARSSPDALTLLDELAEWGDLDVDNLIVVDIIESMDPEVLGALRPVMGARFNQLIDEYRDLSAHRERWAEVMEIVTRRRPDLGGSSASPLELPVSPDVSDEIQEALIDELLEFGFVPIDRSSPGNDEANPYGMTVESLIDFVLRNTVGSDL